MAASKPALGLLLRGGRGAGAAGAGGSSSSSSSSSSRAKSPGAKALIRGVIFSTAAVGLGDYICQWIEDPEHWDRQRTGRMCVATACVMAPTSWGIVMQLERMFPGNHTRAVVSKTVANGLCAAPMISLNFATISFLEGEGGMDRFQGRVGSKLLPTMLSGICFWPAVNFLNFRFVALENRPIVGSFAGVCWNVYMSSIVNSKEHHSHAVVASEAGVVEAPAGQAQQAQEEAEESRGEGVGAPPSPGWLAWPAIPLTFPQSIRFF